MGYYLNHKDMGALGKEKFLIDSCKAQGVVPPVHLGDLSHDTALVCIVSNVVFEAAALIYSESELDAFREPRDRRTKYWFLMPKDLAWKMSGYKE